jgi:ribonuclease Z
LKITVLGIGSATPIVERRPSASLLEIGNESVLIDCGEGTQFQLLKYKMKFSRLRYILITHLHGDHYFGLIALINTINNIGRTEPLTLIGPKGLDEIISVQLKYSQSYLKYMIDYIATNPEQPEVVYTNDKIFISTFPLKHRIPCTGFLISEQAQKRKILAEKLPKNLPVHFYKMLKDGFDVSDEMTGKFYSVEEYTLPPDKPTQVAYCSDTIFDESIVEHIKGVDLLYHESTFTNELADRAAITFHSTAAQAATIAQKANVKQLIIGHFSSRYKTLQLFKEEAQAIFKNTLLAEEGKTYEVCSSIHE